MDIIDIVLARALTPQGQISAYAAQAQKAVRDANAALDAIESITSETDGVRGVIDELQFSITGTNTDELVARTAKVDFPSGKKTVFDSFIKYYRGLGNNEDGAMTQKAITDAIRAVETSAAAAITISDEINGIDILGRNEDGDIALTGIKTESLVKLLAINGLYNDDEVNAYYINYNTNSIEQRNESLDFPAYIGGRRRCNVDVDGKITAFAGIDDNYAEDGSNGDVMVYIPKFYYLRIPVTIGADSSLVEEYLYLSDKQKPGFQLFPNFYDAQGNEIDYILYSAFEAGIYDINAKKIINDDNIDLTRFNKLISYSGAKPVSNINISQFKNLAQQDRSNNWAITDIYAESANQLIMMTFYKTFAIQSYHPGINSIANQANKNCAVQTGNTPWDKEKNEFSPATLLINGNAASNPDNYSYNFFGIENPYGNIWKFIDNLTIQNNKFVLLNRGNYLSKELSFTPPSTSGWVKYFGYDSNFDFLFIPCNSKGSSDDLVKDYYWAPVSSNTEAITVLGGPWNHNDNNGAFYYGFDNSSSAASVKFGARLMYIPTLSDTYYNQNIAKWRNVPVTNYMATIK